MSFKLRNTIVLAVLFVLIAGGGGFYWMYYQPQQLSAAQTEIDRIDRELVDFPNTVRQVEDLTNLLVDTRRRYDSRSKEIPPFDISSQTYAYMSRGIDEAGFTQQNGFIRFNMRYKGSKTIGDYGYNMYELLDGEGEFENLYKFIYFLENGNRLYKVNHITFDNREAVLDGGTDTRKWIAFSMELHAYFTKIPELSTSLAAKSLPVVPSPADPFNPLVLSVVPKAAPEGEINPENVEVKAILPGKVFAMDGEELHVLHLGDKVWNGYVSRISPAESKVEFTLNEGGIIRKLVKKIAFDKVQKNR
ncbi:MAG: hypothetical protein HYZ01_04545 [Ignavibacteriales bacterium]|nr:hypothetical protein [Ignavibacteriales bacterium]